MNPKSFDSDDGMALFSRERDNYLKGIGGHTGLEGDEFMLLHSEEDPETQARSMAYDFASAEALGKNKLMSANLKLKVQMQRSFEGDGTRIDHT